MRDIKAIIEGIVSQGRTVGSGGSAFRHSSSSGAKGLDHGIDVGAHRNQAHEVRAKNAALDSAKKREQEVEKRNKEAEQRQKETAKMAKEETVTEAKKFVYDKPLPAMVKAYDKRDTADLHGMHKRWSSDHSSPKNNPDTSEKLLAVHHVLKSRGENVGELPKHKNLGMTIHEETNTEKREKIKNVARPDDAAPTSEKSTLGKTGQIKTKIIEDKPTMSMPNFGLSASLIAATRQILEKKDDDAGDAKKMTGGKTQVELNPETDDKIDEDGKKHTVPKTPKEKKLAALASPKDKITHKDVLVGRGVVKEEEEQLDELKKSTLGSYVNKAAMDLKHETEYAKDSSGKNREAHRKIAKRRLAGIEKATDRLTKEDVEFSEEEQLDETKLSPENFIKGARRAGTGSTDELIASLKKKRSGPGSGTLRKLDKTELKRRMTTAKEDVEFSAEEIARLDAIAAQLDEAKPTIVSAPIRGANQDQSGIGTKSSSADYTISDSKKMKMKEEAELDESFVVYHKNSGKLVSTHVNHSTAKSHAEKKGSEYSVASKAHWHDKINPTRKTTSQ